MKSLNVITLYDNAGEVEQYIDEALEISGGTVEIALVVNKDTADAAGGIEEKYRGRPVDVIRYGENVGYLNAMLKTIRERETEAYDYVILSNTDIRYGTKDFFRKLGEFTYSPEIGCIAPSVYATKSGSYSNPHYMERVPKAKIEQLIRIFRHPAAGRLYLQVAGIKAGKAKAEKKPGCYVYSPHGCYMIFTKAFTRAIRGYEYGVKLYSEEAAIGELLRKNGMKCYYDDRIEVIHEESSVTGKINDRARFTAWSQSLEYILKEFY